MATPNTATAGRVTVENFRQHERILASEHANIAFSLSSPGRAAFLIPMVKALAAYHQNQCVADEDGMLIGLDRVAMAISFWLSEARSQTVSDNGPVELEELAIYNELAGEAWVGSGPACREIVRQAANPDNEHQQWACSMNGCKRSRGMSLETNGTVQKRVRPGPPTNNRASLSTLPDEIQLAIIDHLSEVLDQASLKLTSRRYHCLVPRPSRNELDKLRRSQVRLVRGWFICIGCIRLRPGKAFCDLEYHGDPESRLCVECGSKTPLCGGVRAVYDAENNYITWGGSSSTCFGPGYCWRTRAGELWVRCKGCCLDHIRDTSHKTLLSRYCVACSPEGTIEGADTIDCLACGKTLPRDQFSRTLTAGHLQCCLSCGPIDLPPEYQSSLDNQQGSGLYRHPVRTADGGIGYSWAFGMDYRWTDELETAWVRCRRCRKGTRVDDTNQASRCKWCSIQFVEGW